MKLITSNIWSRSVYRVALASRLYSTKYKTITLRTPKNYGGGVGGRSKVNYLLKEEGDLPFSDQ